MEGQFDMPSPVIGIVGGGWVNKGAEAMTNTVIEEIRERTKNACRFIVFINRRDMEASDVEPDIQIVYDKPGKFKFILEFLNIAFARITGLQWYYSDTLRSLAGCGAIIDIHGYSLHDKNSLRAILFSLSRILFTKIIGNFYYVFPQSIGPLDKRSKRFFVASILPLADRICVRGQESKAYLDEILIKHAQRIELLPDIALVFGKKFTQQQASRLWRAKNMPTNRTVCALSPNINLLKENPHYIGLMTKLITDIVREYTYAVLLIPHELKAAEKYDDIDLCQDIKTALPEDIGHEDVFIVSDRDYTAMDYKMLVSQCTYMIASRYHMAVAALSLNIPTITIGWAFKYVELLRIFDMEDFAIDGCDEKTVYAQFNQKFSTLIEHQDKIRQSLETLNQNHQKTIGSFFDSVADQIRPQGS